MVSRAANWGPWDYHATVPLLSNPSGNAASTSALHGSLHLTLVSGASSSASTSAALASLVSLPSLPTLTSSSSSQPFFGPGQQSTNQSYSYGTAAIGSMSQLQPRQPPALNMAAAAATHDQSPYSAPPLAQGAYYNNAGGGGGAFSGFSNGNGMMLPSPQSSQLYSSSSGPYNVSSFTSQQDNGPHRLHADVAGLSQSSLQEFHHGSGGSPIDGTLLHGFDGTSMLPLKSKRRQVKNACINCQKACKRCDEGRPCSRCVKYGLSATCQDSARKERKRGIKRGPYKRRATTGSTPSHPSNMLQHSALMMGGVYGPTGNAQPGGMPTSSPHMRPTSMSNSFRADSNGSAASSLYEGSNGGFESSHMMGSGGNYANGNTSAQYSSSAPGSVQRMPTQLAGNSMYESNSPSGYGREHTQVSMQPPAGRPYGSRGDYDRSSGQHALQYSSLSNGGGRYGTNNNSGANVPGSAPAGSMSFGTNSCAGSSLYGGNGNGTQSSSHHRGAITASGPGMFSPNTISQQQNGFLSVHHHRIHSDGSLAAGSANGSAATSSTGLSPRTPMAVNGGQEVGVLAGGDLNKGGQSYQHHPTSTTISSLAPSTASAFMNGGVSSTNSHNCTPQPFPLQLPHASRSRGGSGNNSSHNGSGKEERSRPSSRQDGVMIYHDGSRDGMDYMSSSGNFNKNDFVGAGGATPLSARYQMPVSRTSSVDSRSRAVMPKMDSSTDIAAYGSGA